MASADLVSVVIPAYNAEAFIAEAIDSALAQTYRPIEILVADDGSTDRTAEIVKAYGAPVRYLYQPNAGPAAARNLALRHAMGEYVAFLDADDLWHSDKLSVQVRFMEVHPQAGLCATKAKGLREGWSPEWDRLGTEDDGVHQIAADEFLFRNRFATPSVMARLGAVRDAGGFDESLFGGEDWDLWRRIAERREVWVIRRTLAAYRLRGASFSTNAARMLANNRKVLRKSFADNPGLPWHVRQRARSYLHLDAALEFRKERRWRALGETLLSLALWPFPFANGLVRPALRLRALACLITRKHGGAMADSAMDGTSRTTKGT